MHENIFHRSFSAFQGDVQKFDDIAKHAWTKHCEVSELILGSLLETSYMQAYISQQGYTGVPIKQFVQIII